MAKQILFDEPARKKALKGVTTLADAVSVTLGPKGGMCSLTRNSVHRP